MGPCLCGDPYCNSCFPGNDGGALEAAGEALMQRLSEEKLTPNEYSIVLNVGLRAVAETREVVRKAIEAYKADQAEAKFEDEMEAGRKRAEELGLI